MFVFKKLGKNLLTIEFLAEKDYIERNYKN